MCDNSENFLLNLLNVPKLDLNSNSFEELYYNHFLLLRGSEDITNPFSSSKIVNLLISLLSSKQREKVLNESKQKNNYESLAIFRIKLAQEVFESKAHPIVSHYNNHLQFLATLQTLE